ncbi:MAG TPA: hypothetical protein VF042_09815 [Gemmatimonadaceae bacterium]
MKLKYVLACGLLVACDGATGPGTTGNVSIRFGAATNASARSALQVSNIAGTRSDELTITGTNGTLVIQDVRFIVEEMKLRGSDNLAGCGDDDDDRGGDDNLIVSADRGRDHDEDDGNDDDDECEFEGGPFIVDLPLDGAATIATEDVPAGTYDSFRFKIDDLESDDDDEDDDRARSPELLNQMRVAYPNFPSRASLVVKGTKDGQPFTVYFRSKIRITQPISPPLTIPGDQELTVTIDPTAWLKLGAQVLDLAALNGQLIELGDHFSSGVSGTRHGRH